MELIGDEAQVESGFGLFREVLVSLQDRCLVYAKQIIGLEIILDTPDGTPR
jgi:hypothetical protein